VAQQRQQDLLILGEAVRAVREQHGLSAGGLAAAADIAPARVVALEEGRLDPDFELLLRLAESMDIRPSAFVLRAEALDSRNAENAEAD
jgi:transcriptional regulator with XRE-family HTH domain